MTCSTPSSLSKHDAAACGCGGTHAKTRRRPGQRPQKCSSVEVVEDLHPPSGGACDRKRSSCRGRRQPPSPGAGRAASQDGVQPILQRLLQARLPARSGIGRTGGWRDARPQRHTASGSTADLSKARRSAGRTPLRAGSPPAWQLGHRPSSGHDPIGEMATDAASSGAPRRRPAPIVAKTVRLQSSLTTLGRRSGLFLGRGHPPTRTSISSPCPASSRPRGSRPPWPHAASPSHRRCPRARPQSSLLGPRPTGTGSAPPGPRRPVR